MNRKFMQFMHLKKLFDYGEEFNNKVIYVSFNSKSYVKI